MMTLSRKQTNATAYEGTPRAFADREAIFAYLDRRNPQSARNVKRAIVNAINSVQLLGDR